MKISVLRTVLAAGLAALLAACGSGAQIDQPTQTAAMTGRVLMGSSPPE